MLYFTDLQENANQNQNEMAFVRMAKAKDKTVVSVDKYAGKLEPSCIASGNVKWCSHNGNSLAAFQQSRQRKTNTEGLFQIKRRLKRYDIQIQSTTLDQKLLLLLLLVL